MLYRYLNFFALIFCLLCGSCKTEHGGQGVPQALPPATTPGTCAIRARIKSVIPPAGNGTDVCAKYPCKAIVEILELYGCGPGVSLPLNTGDVVEMSFAFTLHSTEVIPGLKVNLPGLEKGDEFTANASQRLAPGNSGKFVVYEYDRPHR